MSALKTPPARITEERTNITNYVNIRAKETENAKKKINKKKQINQRGYFKNKGTKVSWGGLKMQNFLLKIELYLDTILNRLKQSHVPII